MARRGGLKRLGEVREGERLPCKCSEWNWVIVRVLAHVSTREALSGMYV